MSDATTPALIRTLFGFHSTAAEVVAGIDLSGKRVIVTGASSGIGIETARALASAGADVTLAVRDTGAGGPYFEDCNEAPVLEPGAEGSRGFGVGAYALDPANAERLWDVSLDLLRNR